MNLPDFHDLQDAISMAARAHADQESHEPGIPYISHPCRVLAAVLGPFACQDRDAAIGAVLHDTLEKTSLEAGAIGERFGPKVLALVHALTRDSSESKRAYLKRLADEPWHKPT